MYCSGLAFVRSRRSAFIILCLLCSACAATVKPDVPNIETYLQRSVKSIDSGSPSPPQELSESGNGQEAPESNGHPLSLDSCVQIALDKNPINRAAREGVQAAKESVGEARAPYYPELGLNAGFSRWQRHIFLPGGIGAPGYEMPTLVGPTDDWIAGLKGRFTLFDSGERQSQLRLAMAREGVAEEEMARIRQDLILTVHKAYYGTVAALQTRGVADENLNRAEDHLRLAKERKAAGAVPQADVIRAEVQVANGKLAVVRAESLVRISQGDLNTSMGLPVEMTVAVEGTPGEMISPDTIDLARSFDDAMQHRPELKGRLQRLAAARSTVDSAKSAFGPKVRAEGGYGWQDSGFLPHDEEWSGGVMVDLPLFTGFSRLHRLDRTKAELSKEEAEIENLILDVRREVWTTHSRFKEAFEAVQAAKAAVQDARESLRLVRERYAVGASTINDLLDVQTALARADATLVEAQWEYYTAQSAFDRATGKMNADGKPE